jgi:hypothetical protein
MKPNLNKLDRFVFSLVVMDVKKLTWLFIGLICAEQFISYSIEKLTTGTGFIHGFDTVFIFSLVACYFYYLFKLGDLMAGIITGKYEVTYKDKQGGEA